MTKQESMNKTNENTSSESEGEAYMSMDGAESAVKTAPKKLDFRAPELPKRQANHEEDTSPSSSSKPLSVRRGVLGSQTSTMSKIGKSPNERLNGEADDDSSFSESIQASEKVRRTEAERILYFKNQPECGEVEPHRVHCTRCNSSVNLGKKQTYAVRPWELHRAKCDARAGDTPHFNNNKESTGREESEAKDAESTVALSISGRPTKRTESERKDYLDSDDQVEEVQIDQVKCRRCQKWVRLSNTRSYVLYNWQRHRERCGAATPSSRVATVERKLRLVNDGQAKSFDTSSVECSACGSEIALEGEGDYNLTKWDEHKVTCPSQTESAVTELAGSPDIPLEAMNTVPFPTSGNERKIECAEHTFGETLKRVRSDSTAVMEGEDQRPIIRPRTESYTASGAESPGTLGWILQPLKAFVRGFRESLKGDVLPNIQ